MRRVLHGVGASRGLALGRARVRQPQVLQLSPQTLPAERVEAELQRLDRALAIARAELATLRARLQGQLAREVGEFIDLHVLILDDPELVDGLRDLVRHQRHTADYALKLQRDRLAAVFRSMDNDYFRTRLDDLDHVIGRVHAALQEREDDGRLGLAGEILVADDIAPAELAELSRQQLLAVATRAGSPLSHSAIIARGLGLPMVVGCAEALAHINDGDALLLDGRDGQLIVEPEAADLARYHERQASLVAKRGALERLRQAPTQTRDGTAIRLQANGERREEIAAALAAGADGIGLFRSEFLFMGRSGLPDEEEQFLAYRDAVLGMAGRPVTLRTLDLGADKADDSGLALRNEPNPALGLRGVRLSLSRPGLLDAQLRAMLRASAFGPVRVLVPMVSAREETDAMRSRLLRLAGRLRDEGVAIGDRVAFGIMLEVPATALTLADHRDLIDFVAIGTNDLVQYLLAADRTHEALGGLYSERHPAVLRLLHRLFSEARSAGLPLHVCGELANRPEDVPLLLALGLRDFSVPASAVLEVREAIGDCDLGRLRRRAAALLRCRERAEIEAWLARAVPA
ncbi:phosphoenolpyruvate--protein phosphotransferase [Silanimonas sp.]|uniref:phosphoenolpyruvate--protein phosphotransferase n=1 Tax=Silanimonas sp. TaxID=1929290 RepID=UPI001BBB32F7|nr:phosphoenolpyruvate--protein phosphotransferase [Silanimonas sp.]MBS3896456.1 phosphoenolpyruvate--protein phosphotransferase [Silanimonas sp.]